MEEAENRKQQEEESKHEDEEPASLASQDESSSWAPHLISTEDTWTDLKELEISVKSNEDDGKRVKKYIVTYESKVVQETQEAQRARSRDVSPAVSQSSYFTIYYYAQCLYLYILKLLTNASCITLYIFQRVSNQTQS